MKVERGWFNQLVDRISKSENDEVEVRYAPENATHKQMYAVLEYFAERSKDQVKPVDSLDISYAHSDIRYTILPKTELFWNDNDVIDLGQVTSAMKKRRSLEPVTVHEYNIRFTFKSEEDTSIPELGLVHNDLVASHFRLKRRFSFPIGQNMRLDLTAVRTKDVSRGRPLPQYSDILSCPEHYEIELEWIGEKSNATAQAKEMIKGMTVVLKITQGTTTRLLSKTEIGNVLLEYQTLINKQKNVFIGPNPITMEIYHLRCSELMPGVPCVLNDYVIMDKTDGVRRLLYIDQKGMVYTIDMQFNVIDLEIKTSYKSCVLDGEYADTIFYIFDVYFLNGEDVRDLPLVIPGASKKKSRLSYANELSKKIGSSMISSKEYKLVTPETFANACGYMLRRQNMKRVPYEVDGLIFTPSESVPPENGGTWPAVLKWKPPEFSTIDFKVQFTGQYTGKKQIIAELLIGQNAASSVPITPWDYVTGTALASMKSSYNSYVMVPFEPPVQMVAPYFPKMTSVSRCHLEMKDMSAYCRNGDQIMDGSIVEFAFDSSSKVMDEQARWYPLRVRWDKVVSNNINNANAVWRSIVNPVSTEMLMNKPVLEKTLKRVFEDKGSLEEREDYYMSVPHSLLLNEEKSMESMRRFHNWIKREVLLAPFAARSLFDFGCGRGGDIQKWIDTGVKRVVGIDKFDSNLTDPNDGAFARLLQTMRKRKVNMDVVFLPIDASDNFMDEKYSDSIMADTLRYIYRVLWGKVPLDSIDNGNIRRYYKFIQSGGFDLASAMFMVHYLFDAEDRLNQFAENVASVLRSGGHIVGTCLDGAKVESLFDDKSIDGDSVSGRDEKTGKLQWRITRQWGKGKVYGRQIDVFVASIGQELPEFLVDYKVLKAVFSKHGLQEVKTGMFDELYKDYIVSTIRMSADEKSYSFLNRYFIFKKK